MKMTAERSDYIFSMAETESRTRIVAMGIGGMGRNAMENLARCGISDLEVYSVNTDMQALDRCQDSLPVQIGEARTGGKGAGGNSEVGKLSAEDDIDKMRGLVEGAELVFIAAGMGGGTGTGAAPVIAKLCRELGVLTIGTVTMPMEIEGIKRKEKATKGLVELRKHVDSLVVIENERLSLVMGDEDISMIEAFRRADEVLTDGVEAVTRLINSHGYINLDLADLRNVLQRPGSEDCADVLIGVGQASGEDRALQATSAALENPLLARDNVRGADNLLVNVAGDDNLGLNEANLVMDIVKEAAGDSVKEIFMGFVNDSSMGDRLSVTLIATGMGTEQAIKPDLVKPSVVREVRVESKISGMAEVAAMEKPGRPVRIDGIVQGQSGSESAAQNNMSKPVNAESFGFSPLVSNSEWRIPACQRRVCRHQVRPEQLSRPLVGKTDVRKEVSTFMRTKRKNRRVFREPTLRMAC
jgi:cell division protein FtsZ